MPQDEITPSSWSAGSIFHGKKTEDGDFNYLEVVRKAVLSANSNKIDGTAQIFKKWLPISERHSRIPTTFVIQSDSSAMLEYVMIEVRYELQRIDRQILVKSKAHTAHEPLPMDGDLYLPPVRAAPYIAGVAAGGGGGGGGAIYRPPHVLVPRPGSMAHAVECGGARVEHGGARVEYGEARVEYGGARVSAPAPRPPSRPAPLTSASFDLSSRPESVISEEVCEVRVLTAKRKLQIAAAEASSAHIDSCLEIYLEVMRDPVTPESVILETRQALLDSVIVMGNMLTRDVLLMPPRPAERTVHNPEGDY